jgi:glycine oxidase
VKVIVVGAGIAGCAIAYELARRGAQVHVLDGRAPGRGATFASAGILTPAIEGHNPQLLHLTSCSLAAYDDFIRRVRDDSGFDVDYARNGTLQVAFTSGQADELEESARRFAATGVAHTFLDGGDARALEPALSPSVVAALRLPAQGYVSAEQLVSALAHAATRCGAAFATGRVERMDGTGNGAAVFTAAERLEADAVVIATGSWVVPPMGIDRPVPVTPIRGQLLHVRVDEPVASHVLWGPDCYIVPWRDRTVLIGATVEDVGFDERSTIAGVRSLSNAAVDLVPALDGASLQEVRVGLRPKTEDELPAIGRSSTMRHVFYALGLYRNGVLLAPLTASLIADLVLEGREREELAMVRPARLGL